MKDEKRPRAGVRGTFSLTGEHHLHEAGLSAHYGPGGRLDDVRAAAQGTANLMPRFLEAVDSGATLGEICDVLRGVFGKHVATETLV